MKSDLVYLDEFFSVPGFIQDEALTFGYQVVSPMINKSNVPDAFKGPDLNTILYNLGAQNVVALDYFDKRAELRFDMNNPVPKKYHNRFGTLVDIGSLEHVFDVKQALINCMKMLKPRGMYLLAVPVKGYYSHGIHTFTDPKALVHAFVHNKFEIVEVAYSTRARAPISDPREADEVMLWLMTRKIGNFRKFRNPQQVYWEQVYKIPLKYELEGIESEDRSRLRQQKRKKAA